MTKRLTKKVESKLIRQHEALGHIHEELNATAGIRFCPWCGTRPEVRFTHPGTAWVQCMNCGAQGPGQYDERAWRKLARRAVDAWNAMRKSRMSYRS